MRHDDHEILQKRGRGRPRKLSGAERAVIVRLAPEMIAVMGSQCRPGESREDYIRAAIERELKRRSARKIRADDGQT